MKKYKWQIIGGSVALLVLIIVISVLVTNNRKNKRTYENFDVIGKTREFGENSEVNYLPSAKGIFRYTRDGAEVVDRKGKSLETVSYNMNKPCGDTCGNAAAIGEIGGKSMVVLDAEGEMHTFSMPYQIVKIQVASQGVTAIWMTNEGEDYVQICKADGTKIVEMNTLVATSGFPVDIALSNDGTKLVTAFASFDGDQIQTQLSFYNFGSVGGNFVDGFVSAEVYKDELLADVEFVDNNSVVAFGDHGYRFFDMEEIPDLKYEVKIEEKICSVASTSSLIGVIVESNAKGGNYLVRIYNRSGKLLDEKSMTEGFAHFYIDKEDVILFNDTDVYIYRVGGRDKIRIDLKKNLKYVASLDANNEFLFVGDTYMERVRLVGEKKK